MCPNKPKSDKNFWNAILVSRFFFTSSERIDCPIRDWVVRQRVYSAIEKFPNKKDEFFREGNFPKGSPSLRGN